MQPWLHGKPAVKILLPFIAGIACARIAGGPWILPALALALLLPLALIALRHRREQLFTVVVVLACFSAGGLRLMLALQLVAQDDVRRMADWPAPVSLEGTISAPVERKGDRQLFVLATDSLWSEERGFAVRGHTRIIFYDTLLTLRQGDRLVAKGMLRSPAGAGNPGGFDYRAWLAAQGIHSQMGVAGPARLLLLARDQDPLIQRLLVRPLRGHILRVVDSTLDGESRALLSALLVGVQSDIDDELRQEFSAVGVVHVLAVSGLHVGFVLAALLLGINLLRIPHRARLPLLLAALWIYTLVTGSAPPVVRAAVMGALLLAAPALQRRLDPVNAIALAALAILLANPLDLFGAGFQLSFAATLGILLIYRRLDRWAAVQLSWWRRWDHSWRKSALQLLMVSLAAQVATLPLTAWYFNNVPLYGLLANLLVVPLSSLIVMTGFLAVTVAAISSWAGFIVMQCDWLFLQALIHLVKGTAALPGAALDIATPSLWLLALWYLALGLVLSWPQPRLAKAWLLAMLAVANGWIWSEAVHPRHEARILFFDAGQGDAALLAFPNGVHLLIDAGDANARFDCGRSVILPWLRREGIAALDAVFVTHSHADHAGGVATLLRQGRIRTLYHPGGTALPAFRSLDSLARRCNVAVHAGTAGSDLYPAPGAWLRILQAGGSGGEPWDENNGSMVIRLQYGRRIFLFLSDIEIAGEASLLACGDLLPCDVVKVAHHGSPGASSEALLSATAAHYAIIPVGRGNAFHLPSAAVVARWQAAGARVLRTDESGAVLFASNGDTLRCLRP